MSTIFLDPSNIFVGHRLRALNPVAVENLKKSISQIGLRTPISVRRIEDEDEPWGLVTGRHRLQACIELGFEKVESREESGTDLDAQLWEIAENLHRAELSLQERSEHIAEWVRLTEENNKCASCTDIPRGPGQPEGGVAAAARKLGIERTEATRAIKRTEDIPAEVRDEIRGTKIGDSGVQLDALAKAKDDPDRQLAAVLAVKAGEVKDVRDVLQPDWRSVKKTPEQPPPAPPIVHPPLGALGDPAQVVETDDPPQPVAPAEHSEPEQEKLPAATAPSPETIFTGAKVDHELLKWTAAFRSWPWHRQETALSLIEVDEDSVAALKEDHDLLELKELIIIALKEDISRLEQENRSLRERLASQLDPKPEPYQHREPERAEPEQAEPVLADAVAAPKPAAPEVIEQEQREREPDPAQSLSELDRETLRIFQEHAAVSGVPWIGVAGREIAGIDEDAVDRLVAAGHIVQSPGNPHAYGIPVGDPRRREDEDVEEATPPSMAA